MTNFKLPRFWRALAWLPYLAILIPVFWPFQIVIGVAAWFAVNYLPGGACRTCDCGLREGKHNVGDSHDVRDLDELALDWGPDVELTQDALVDEYAALSDDDLWLHYEAVDQAMIKRGWE